MLSWKIGNSLLRNERKILLLFRFVKLQKRKLDAKCKIADIRLSNLVNSGNKRYSKKFRIKWHDDDELSSIRDTARPSNMKVAPSISELREMKNSPCAEIKSLLALSRDLSIAASKRMYIGRIMRMHFYRAWKHYENSSRILVCRARPCLLHVTYTRNENFQGRAQPARNFSLFFVRRYGRLRATSSTDWPVFFQGPIGLDGPKGDPVSFAT